MRKLLAEIERVLPDGGDWCTPHKANVLASLVVALRPSVIVEIGVFSGGSAIPLLLALAHVGSGRLIAIDPWSADASAIDQEGPNKIWWSAVDHGAAYRKFLARLEVHGLAHLCTICHRPSDQCEPPVEAQIVHIDGNHGAQAVRDVERFASRVTIGGILVLDDLEWGNGDVMRAHTRATEIGFRDLYPLGTGVVMQRSSYVPIRSKVTG